MMIDLDKNSNRGVEYNIKITKRKHKDNIIQMIPLSLYSSCEVSTSPDQMASEDGQSAPQGSEVISYATAYSTPRDMLTKEKVKKAIIQLFKNEDRYKLKIRINAFIDGEDHDVDFIAPLTLDRRNFVKYTPPECGDWFIQWSDEWCKEIKREYNVKAYRGKFHLSQGFIRGKKVITQVEPWCQCVVWYNPLIKNWFVSLNLYEFELVRELTDQSITLKQKTNNLHRQDIWTNPQHDHRIRPLTWAQRMAKK